jgi:hypothetical protein
VRPSWLSPTCDDLGNVEFREENKHEETKPKKILYRSRCFSQDNGREERQNKALLHLNDEFFTAVFQRIMLHAAHGDAAGRG